MSSSGAFSFYSAGTQADENQTKGEPLAGGSLGPDQLITNHGYRYHFATMERGSGYKTAALKGIETVSIPASMISIARLLMQLADVTADERAPIRKQLEEPVRKALSERH